MRLGYGHRELIMFGSFALLSFATTSLAVSSSQSMRGSMHHAVFTKNVGQWPDSILFQVGAPGGTLWFVPDGIFVQLAVPEFNSSSVTTEALNYDSVTTSEPSVSSVLIRSRFAGASPDVQVEGTDALSYTCNYFLGDDRNKWRTHVPTYGSVTFHSLYPGVDLRYYVSEEQLEYDFSLAPGADYSQIRIEYENVAGLSVDDAGDLIIATDHGNLREKLPLVYQTKNGARQAIGGAFQILGPKVFGFHLDDTYDPSLTLVIDPIVVYSTYLGGGTSGFGNPDYATGVAVDSTGAAYITGATSSADFPVVNPYQGSGHLGAFPYDVFVTKMSSAGDSLLFSTYIGGESGDNANGIAIDHSGNVYITGGTASSGYPMFHPFQSTGGTFVTKLSSDGDSLYFSTRLGDYDADKGYAIAVDTAGAAYITGLTFGPFPTKGAVQSSPGGSRDAFVAKIAPSGDSLIYSTYLGGSSGDEGYGIAVNGAGEAFVTGYTTSGNFPTHSAYQSSGGGSYSAFVTKFSSSGGSLVYSTYLHQTFVDSKVTEGTGIALDSTGSAYVTGYTQSTSFPLVNAFQNVLGGLDDGFVSKFSPTGTSLLYSTYLGGSANDEPIAIAVDRFGAAVVAGQTGSLNYPLRNPYQRSFGGGNTDFSVTKLAAAGDTLIYSSYLGGTSNESARGVAVDPQGNLYVVGSTSSSNFPVFNAYQSTLLGFGNATVAKIDLATVIPYLQLSAFQLTYGAIPGGSLPPSQSFSISNTAGGTLNWQITDSVSWLDVTPLSGTGNSQSIQVAVNTTSLGSGTFHTSLVVSSDSSSNGPQVVSITYTIQAPHVQLSAASLSFSAVRNEPLPASQSFTLTNSGGGTLDWTVSDSASWLDVTPASGTSNSQLLTVSVNTTNLSTGTYTTSIVVAGTNADNSPKLVSVSFTVATQQHIELDRTGLTFTGVKDAALPPGKQFILTNGGGGTLNWTVSDSVSWLTESPSSGSSNSLGISVSIASTNLPLGTYQTTVVVGSSNADNAPQTVLVTYYVVCCSGRTGNVDCSPGNGVDIGDLTALIDNLFISFTPLCCEGEANCDGVGGVDIGDLTALIDNLFITFTPLAGCQ